MVSTNVVFLVAIFVLCDASKRVTLDSYDEEANAGLIPKFFNSLDKAFKYFEKEYEQVNLDAIFGLRLSEAVLENVLTSMKKDLSARNSTPLSVSFFITKLRNRATTIILKSLTSLKISDEDYFKKVGFVVKNKWRFVKPFKKLNSKGNTREIDREVTTNIGRPYQPCMVALFGSGGPGYEPCNVTDRCWKVMTRTDNIGYTLTHQALYFMFGKERGCSSVLSTKLKQSNIQGGYERLFKEICTSMYNQMLILENVKAKTHAQTDLYLEQSVICGGLLGYSDFLSMERLAKLVKLQRSNGCFGKLFYDSKTNRMRKRTAKILADGCESHLTGVATGLLSSYVRWILQTQKDTIS